MSTCNSGEDVRDTTGCDIALLSLAVYARAEYVRVTRLAYRVNKSLEHIPVDDRFSGGSTRTPNSVIHTSRRSLNMQGTATQVLTNSTVARNARRVCRLRLLAASGRELTANHALEIPTDVNLAFNPATGAPYSFNDTAHLVVPGFGSVVEDLNEGQDRYHGLDLSWTKRMSHNWQASATYSFSYKWNWQHIPPAPGCQYLWTFSSSGSPQCNVPIALHPVFRDEWYRAGDQVNRGTFNGIWQAPLAIQLSGFYF